MNSLTGENALPLGSRPQTAKSGLIGRSNLTYEWSNYPLRQDNANWNGWIYHTYAFCLVEPLKLVWLCELLPPIKIDCPICVV